MTLGKAMWIKASCDEGNFGFDVIFLHKHWWHCDLLPFVVINLSRTLLISASISLIKTDPFHMWKNFRLILGQLSVMPWLLLPGRVSIWLYLWIPILHWHPQKINLSICCCRIYQSIQICWKIQSLTEKHALQCLILVIVGFKQMIMWQQ